MGLKDSLDLERLCNIEFFNQGSDRIAGSAEKESLSIGGYGKRTQVEEMLLGQFDWSYACNWSVGIDDSLHYVELMTTGPCDG